VDSFTLVDGAVALVIVVSAILAYARGLLREILAILGWIVAAIAAFLLAPVAEPLVREIPYVGDFLRDSCELGVIAAFAAVFAVVLILVAIFTPLFSGAMRNSALGGIDQGLGFFFGVLRGLLLVAVAFMIYEFVAPTGAVPVVDQSQSIAIFDRFKDQLAAAVPQDVPDWFARQYEVLVAHCAPPPAN
jgi:membrane protein required for colicin V production